MDRLSKILLKDTFIYAIGDIGIKLVGFILLPIYTRELSPSEYGTWDLIQTLQLIILPVIYLQIIDGVYRFLLDKNISNAEVIYTSSIFIFISFSFFIILFIIIFLFLGLSINYITLICAFYLFQGLFQYLLQVARGLNQIKLYALAGLTAAVLAGIINAVLILFYNFDYSGIIIGTTAGLFFGSIIIFFQNKFWKYLYKRNLNLNILKDLLKFSAPLMPNAISWWIINFSDRIILKIFISLTAVGFYGIAAKVASLIFIMNAIFNKAWVTFSVSSFDKENSLEEIKERSLLFSKIFNILLKVQFTGVILLTILTYYFGQFLLGDNFNDALVYIPILGLAAVFQSFSMFYGTIYWGIKNTKGALYTTIYASIINVALNLIFIPIYGIYAAVYSTLFSYLCLWLFRKFTTSNYIEINIDYRFLFLGFLLFTGVYINIFFIGSQIITALLILILAFYIYSFISKLLLRKTIL